MSEPWTFRFAERMEGVKTSKIRELFDAGRQRPDAIDLSIGQADFDVPTPIREATVAAIEEGCGGYSTTEGYADVVAAATAPATAAATAPCPSSVARHTSLRRSRTH